MRARKGTSGDLDTFLKQDALQEGVFIPQHETLISSGTVALL